MEALVSSGLVRNIGVSNFNAQLLMDLVSYATILPAVNQVELHPLLTQETLVRYCAQVCLCLFVSVCVCLCLCVCVCVCLCAVVYLERYKRGQTSKQGV